MEFYDVVNRRRTVRDFSNKEVPHDTVKRILEAGIKAPSNDHLRNWEFVVVRGRDEVESVIKRIPVNMNKQVEILSSRRLNECQQNMYADAMPKQYRMLYESGCLLLPFYKQNGDLLQPKALNSLNAFAAMWCCIENILLAATAEGLASALRIPIGDEAEYVSKIVQAPQNYVMPCYISIGYPNDNAVLIEQMEINIEDRIHYGRWCNN